MNKHIVLAVSIVALAAAGTARADEFSVIGFDAKSLAVGGALTGEIAGPASAYYNPAGLNQKKQVLDFTYTWFKPNFSIDRDANPDMDSYIASKPGSKDSVTSYNLIRYRRNVNNILESKAENPPLIRGYTLGIGMPLAPVREEAEAAFAIGVYLPQGILFGQRINRNEAPIFIDFDDRAQRFMVQPALSYDITPKLHVGVGGGIILDVNVQADVYIPLDVRISKLITASSKAGLPIEIDPTPILKVDVPPIVTPTAGVIYEVNDKFSIGTTFRDEVVSNINVNSNISLATGTPSPAVLPMTVNMSSNFTPRQLAAGARWKVGRKLVLFGDATWSQWSRFKPNTADITVSGLRKAVLNILNGSGIDELGVLGEKISLGIGDSEPIPITVPTKSAILDMVPNSIETKFTFSGAKDIITPRVGASYMLNDRLTAMVGYFYRPSFEEDSGFRLRQTTVSKYRTKTTRETKDVNINMLDNNQHGFSGGATYVYNAFHVTLSGLYLKLTEKTMDKENNFSLSPTDEDGNSKNGRQTNLFGYPKYTYGGSAVAVAAQAGLSF